MEISAYLYDANGSDKKIDLRTEDLKNLNEKQILWIDISKRDKKIIEQVAALLNLENIPVKSILNVSERPKLDKFETFYHFFVASTMVDERGNLSSVPIDYLVGENFVITIHDRKVNYFQEFREREKGETQIGDLDTEGFVVSLLDLHLVTYFRMLEEIDHHVDQLDEEILGKDLNDDEFLKRMVKLRSDVSKLRRWFLPHRDVFYALSRPDFKPNADSDFKTLNEHFETAVDSIESSRETVLSLFDLYTTKTSHRMTHSMRRLTFVTVLVGGMGVVAGVLGMNFKEDFFDVSNGFWIAIGAMISLAATITTLAWRKRWI